MVRQGVPLMFIEGVGRMRWSILKPGGALLELTAATLRTARELG
jgi:hypothetical protein